MRRSVLVSTALALAAVVACRPQFPAGGTLGTAPSGAGHRIWWPTASDPDAGQTIGSYRIDVDGVPLVTVPGTTQTCTLTGLPAGTHDVRVTAFDTGGEWSGDAATDGEVVGPVVVGEPTSAPARCIPLTSWRTAGATTGTSVSADGRFVASLGDDGPYVWDRTEGVAQSLAHPASTAAEDPAEISGDGRFVTFVGPSDPATPGPVLTWPILVWDRSTGVVEPVPDPPAGHRLLDPSISGDGRYVAFTALSPATASPGDSTPPNRSDIWLWDRATGESRAVASGDGISFHPDVASDGSVVVFASAASNLVGESWDGDSHIYVYEVATGAIVRIPHARLPGVTGMGRTFPTVSDDGDTVVFASGSGPPTRYQLWVWERGDAAAAELAPAISGYWHREISISADGSTVVFNTRPSAIVPGESDQVWDVFLWDRDQDALIRVSDGNGLSRHTAISGDGDVVTFTSSASDLLGPTGNRASLYAWDRRGQ